MEKELKDRVERLEKELAELKSRRIRQEMLLPDVVKARHIGAGVRFIRSGLAANIPTTGEGSEQGEAIYFETDTNKLKVYNSTDGAWVSTTLS